MRTGPPKSARLCNSDVFRVLRFLRVPEVCFEVCPWNPVLRILRVLRVMRVFFACPRAARAAFVDNGI